MNPLEAAWNTSAPRPYYVVIDSVKSPSSLRPRATRSCAPAFGGPDRRGGAVDERRDLVQRQLPGEVRGDPLGFGYGLFVRRDLRHRLRDGGDDHDLPVTGANLSKGLRKLAGGATSIEVGTQKVLAAFQKLVAGESISAVGTFGPLEWDNDGAVLGGVIQMWCIGAPSGGAPAYQASGLNFDLKTQKLVGSYKQCL